MATQSIMEKHKNLPFCTFKCTHCSKLVRGIINYKDHMENVHSTSLPGHYTGRRNQYVYILLQGNILLGGQHILQVVTLLFYAPFMRLTIFLKWRSKSIFLTFFLSFSFDLYCPWTSASFWKIVGGSFEAFRGKPAKIGVNKSYRLWLKVQ